MVKNLPANAGDTGSILGQENPMEKEMATQYTILTWEIPWTGREIPARGVWQATVDRVTKESDMIQPLNNKHMCTL